MLPPAIPEHWQMDKQKFIANMQQVREDLMHELEFLPGFENATLAELRAQHHYLSYPTLAESYKKRVEILSRIADIDETLRFFRNKHKNVPAHAHHESAVGYTMQDNGISAKETTENVVDIMGDKQDVTSLGSTHYFNMGQKSDMRIEKFFERPVMISSGTFALGSYYNLKLGVSDLWSLEPSVRAKLRNFSYFKGNLHVRIALSGTPFHYGKLMVSGQPYAANNANLANLATLYALGTTGRWPLVNYLSQSRARGVMDVRENKPLELVLPFISTKPMHRIFNTSAAAIAAGTSLDDFTDWFSLYLTNINAFATANTSITEGVQYFVYAWATDVELGLPTGTQLAVTTEADTVDDPKDEREIGPVEHYSSAIAHYLGLLRNAPVIGPVATASHMAFDTAAKISSIFGWSKPTVIDMPMYVKNRGYSCGAQTIGYETCDKLTLDPKQELAVDSSFMGTSSDEMSLQYIANIESYLTTFVWRIADTPLNWIWYSGVSPALVSQYVNTGVYFSQPTAMCFAAQPFSSWHGDIEFTFEFVCSQFHRGKIMVGFEPNMNQALLFAAASQDINKRYAKIIDLQETQCVTFRVNWAQYRAWASMPNLATATTVPYNQAPTGTYGIGNPTQYNGLIFVMPITDLVSPTGDDLQINVYVRAPRLLLNRLTQANLPTSRNISVGFAREKREIVEAKHESALHSSTNTVMDLNDSVVDAAPIALHHFGELPVSFRGLLKRFTLEQVLETAATTLTVAQMNISMNIMPVNTLPYGTSGGSIFNLWGYLYYAYIGYRGGIRRRFRVLSNAALTPYTTVPIVLKAEANAEISPAISILGVAAGGANLLNSAPTLEGGQQVSLSANAGFEVEFPFYSRNLYHYAFANDFVGTNPGGDQGMDTYWTRSFSFSVPLAGTVNTQHYGVMADVAAADDFSFIGFQGAPLFTT